MIAAKNTSWLSKISAGIKFGTLLVMSIALYLIPWWWLLLALLILSVLLLFSARIAFRQISRALLTLTIILSIVFIVLGLQTSWWNAGTSVTRLLTLCLLAYSVSLTTPFNEMLDLFQRIAYPLRHIGANPAQIALALSMTLRFIPELRKVYLEVREAQHARGLGNNPIAVSVPLVIRSLRIADETAEALDARGYDSSPGIRHDL